MKVVFLIFVCLLCKSVSAQTFYPFQVLYAENANLNSGKELKSLDMVSVEETITVGKGGYLALVHDSGFPIEVNRDTILALNPMHNSITKSAHKKRRFIFKYQAYRFRFYIY